MGTSSVSPRLSELIESSASRLTILIGALRTLQVPDPRLNPLVLNEILGSAIRHATELEDLMARAATEANQGG